ncbi:MAG: HlyD family efflux transporter periplasmic adaptor subunit, partial [Bacteroidota bacterium]
LQQYLEAWAKASDYIFQQELPILDQLGSMQPLYADFSQKLRAYQYLAGTTSTAQKIKAIQQQRQELVALNATLERQQAILAQEVALAKQKLEDDKTLLSQNAATATDVDASETEYLAYSRQLEGLQGQIINNRIRREELSVQLVELREVRDQQLSTERIALNEDRKRLQQALDDWEAQFLVRTPIAGRVSMQQLRTPQQYLQAATEILTILPATAQNRILAKAEVAPQGFGKLELGQEVQLRLAGYPYQEYGALEGQVSELANIPENGLYTATVSLVSPLVTNANDTIPFQQELLAEARFITADKRVLQRIFDRFDALFRD